MGGLQYPEGGQFYKGVQYPECGQFFRASRIRRVFSVIGAHSIRRVVRLVRVEGRGPLKQLSSKCLERVLKSKKTPRRGLE